MSRPMLCVIGAFIGLLSLHAAADVYKYVDEKGQVQYTDKPELLPAEILAKIKSQRTDKSAVADRVAGEQQQAETTNANQSSAADQKKAQQTTAADKAERCTKARERYDQMTAASHVYTQNEKGEKVLMDDKQTAQARASAKQLMDTWCN